MVCEEREIDSTTQHYTLFPSSSSSLRQPHTMSEQPWIEKYRPKSLNEVTSQNTTIDILSKSLQNANLPHMLFYGPPGTGKTSTILALANELYGPKLMQSRVLELNASDERGISIVRDRIKTFARLSISNPSDEDLHKYPCPPYKLIILDEADSMTSDAQSALRRTMETYAGVTRFCLICNYVTKIIDPLASRCSKFRFRLLDHEMGINRLKYIADHENVDVDDAVIEEILQVCEGDLRRAVNLLQCFSTILSGGDGKELDIKEVFGYLPESLVDECIKKIRGKDLVSLTSFLENEIVKSGYSASFVLIALHRRLLLGGDDDELSACQKNEVAHILWQVDNRVSVGCNENVQLLQGLYRLSGVI